jgi:hypothetical protein
MALNFKLLWLAKSRFIVMSTGRETMRMKDTQALEHVMRQIFHFFWSFQRKRFSECSGMMMIVRFSLVMLLVAWLMNVTGFDWSLIGNWSFVNLRENENRIDWWILRPRLCMTWSVLLNLFAWMPSASFKVSENLKLATFLPGLESSDYLKSIFSFWHST